MPSSESLLTGSHPVGRVIGTEVRVLYILYIAMGVLLLALLPGHTPAGMLFQTLAILLLPVYVFLHEMGHTLAAIKEGLRVPRIYLTPIGGMAMLEGRTPGPMAEIVIALAGPFVSLLIAALASIPLLIVGMSGSPAFAPIRALCFLVIGANLILALFNLLPFFPMDGGRVLTAALVLTLGPERAIPLVGKVARFGMIGLGCAGVVILLTGGVSTGLILLAIAVFGYTRGNQELSARAALLQYAGAGASPAFQPSWQGAGASDAPMFHSDGAPQPGADSGWLSRWRERRKHQQRESDLEKRETMNREVDRILEKVQREGLNSLTAREKSLLGKASRMYRDR